MKPNRTFSTLLLFLLIELISHCPSFSQEKGEDQWGTLRVLIGTWTGTAKGEPGDGQVEREYRLVLGEAFIEVTNKSTYRPLEKTPAGEVHEDLGMISYDGGRKKCVLRQFHAEGFVNQYTLDSISADGKTLVFTTEAIENIPAGWKARETYHIIDDNSFTETFELAGPGKEFEVYSTTQLKRKPH